MLAFVRFEPTIIHSGTIKTNGKMAKHSSGQLRYTFMNIAMF